MDTRSLAWWRLWLSGSLLGVALSLWLSLGTAGPALSTVSDKWQHLVGYAVLTLWFCGLVERRHHWRLLLACIAYGGVMEILQGTLTTGRQADWLDVVANGSGALMAVMVARTGVDGWAQWLERLAGSRA
jgi:VanZ family protein